MDKQGPLVLVILDGWGYSETANYNAISQANTPQWNEWWRVCPHALLNASGYAVGLPGEQMGNSEVGHMHIGAGRIIEQDFTRINQAITTGKLNKHPELIAVMNQLKTSHNILHLMGLCSPGGVHSHEDHLKALIALCQQQQVPKVCIHLFLDGRDTPPQSAIASIEHLNEQLASYPQASIASITGRYYAMDRDNRWERIEPVYTLLTQGISPNHAPDALSAVTHYYEQNLSDEFIPPTVIGNASPMADGDALLFFNFRADRARQLTTAFVDEAFSGFKRSLRPKLSHFISMTQYDKKLATTSLFPPISMENTLGEVIAKQGLRQLRIAETEKYAHVTFFFNGGKEALFDHEQRILIPSPKVATYDLQPQMSAPELTDQLVAAINSQDYDVIICNYANADMVGHSGNFAATLKAVECLDQCLARVGAALKPLKGNMLISADHGNAEQMFNEHSHQAHTAHTSGPVPLLFVGDDWHFVSDKGSLIDIAPTMLHLLGITPPDEMTGSVLLEKNHA